MACLDQYHSGTMIRAKLRNSLRATYVSSGITDIADMEQTAVDEGDDERAPHSHVCWLLAGNIQNSFISVAHDLSQHLLDSIRLT
jgi:hypothetical protein